MRILVFLPVSLCYIPQRTPQRDKLFFGIDSPAVVAAIPGVLPPASSQLGVNSTAASDHVLNDYGSLGIPNTIEATIGSTLFDIIATPSQKSFVMTRRKEQNSAAFTVKHALEYMSIVWLVLLLVGCYYFVRAALNGALSKTYKMVKQEDPIAAKIDSQNQRIDREAYVYIEGG
jgi:hypothetical protein